VNELIGIDDGMEVFKLHGIGGICGAFLTGLFATSSISALDGSSIYPGAIDGNGKQVYLQLAEIAAISGYSFTVSCILLYMVKFIPGMKLRGAEDAEIDGLDRAQFVDEQIGDWSMFDSYNGGTYNNGSPGVVEKSAETKTA
jgi:Amt family ammonium transporter